LVAFLFFNDAIQTVISVASVFFAQELFVARGREVDNAFLLGLMLMVQFVGFAGALIFERVAALAGAKNALLLSLAVWSGVVVYAWGAFHTQAQAWGMAAIIAVVLGGSQALSRSAFSCMIPPQREAAFFGLYEIANSGTSWIGPFIFALVVSATNSYRRALLSLIVLFAIGFLLLVLTDTERAIQEAGQA
jgi:UMF1 family MFS transporter